MEHIPRLSNWMQKGIDTGTLDMACCRLRKPFNIYSLVQNGEEYIWLMMVMRQRAENRGLLVRWHYLEFFAVLPAMHLLFHASMSVFWNESESSRLSHVPSPPCLAYYTGVQSGSDDCNTQQIRQMVAFELVILALSAFFQTVCHCDVTRVQKGRIQQSCGGRGMLVWQNKRIWILLGKYGFVRVLSCFEVDPIQGLYALARFLKSILM